MDVKTLLSDAKARFSYNSAKDYLREKYSSKFLVADQGGLWEANIQTIVALESFNTKKIILIDTYKNPVEVDRSSLLKKLKTVYTDTMQEYHAEYKELENKR